MRRAPDLFNEKPNASDSGILLVFQQKPTVKLFILYMLIKRALLLRIWKARQHSFTVFPSNPDCTKSPYKQHSHEDGLRCHLYGGDAGRALGLQAAVLRGDSGSSSRIGRCPSWPWEAPLCVTTLAREEDQGQATNHPRLVHVWDAARLSPTRPPVTWAVTLMSGSERPPPTQELTVCYGFCCDLTCGIRL